MSGSPKRTAYAGPAPSQGGRAVLFDPDALAHEIANGELVVKTGALRYEPDVAHYLINQAKKLGLRERDALAELTLTRTFGGLNTGDGFAALGINPANEPAWQLMYLTPAAVLAIGS